MKWLLTILLLVCTAVNAQLMRDTSNVLPIELQIENMPEDYKTDEGVSPLFPTFRQQSIVKYALIFVAGAADGLNQTLLFHYDNFKRVHPDANDQFWYPYISYSNKGTTLWGRTFGASFSDGHHLTRWVDRNSMLASGTLVILSNGKNAWGYLFDFALGFILRTAGFHFTYSIIYHE